MAMMQTIIIVKGLRLGFIGHPKSTRQTGIIIVQGSRLGPGPR